MLAQFLSSSALRFGLVGIINTVVGLGCIFALKYYFGLADTPANLIGYSVGISLSYVLNARWTFRFEGRLDRAILRYAAVLLVAYAANLIFVNLGIRVLHWNSYLSQAVGVVPYAGITYVLSRAFVFRSKGQVDQTATRRVL